MMHSVAKFLSFNFSQLARGEATEAAWAPAPPRAPSGAVGLGRISLLQSFFFSIQILCACLGFCRPFVSEMVVW